MSAVEDFVVAKSSCGDLATPTDVGHLRTLQKGCLAAPGTRICLSQDWLKPGRLPESSTFQVPTPSHWPDHPRLSQRNKQNQAWMSVLLMQAAFATGNFLTNPPLAPCSTCCADSASVQSDKWVLSSSGMACFHASSPALLPACLALSFPSLVQSMLDAL